MTYNRSEGQSADELRARAVAALVREWGVTAKEAGEAIERVKEDERRRRRNGTVIHLPEPREPEPVDGWTVYLDHGELTLGQVECHVQ